MCILQTHYSKPMDWTSEKRIIAEEKLSYYIETIARYGDLDAARTTRPLEAIVDALADDLNTHAALVYLDKLAGRAGGTQLAANLDFLGILSLAQIEDRVLQLNSQRERLLPLAAQLQAEREQAKSSKDFSRVDALKARLLDAGVMVQMQKDTVSLEPGHSFDPAKLETIK